MDIAPGIGTGSGGYQGIQIYNVPTSAPPLLNFTAAFSFAPPKGFVRITSAALTVVDITGTLSPQGLSIRLNRQSSGSIALAQATSAISSVGTLSSSAIHPGLNLIDIGSSLTNSGVTLYEITLTVEYTFLS